MNQDGARHDDVTRLLIAATASATANVELLDRRRRLLIALAEIASADAGHWAWGRGNPATSTIAPVAMIDFGYSAEQRTILIEQALSEASMSTFQRRALSRLDERGQLVVTRQDVIPDDEWRSTPHLVSHVAKLGLDAWLHGVRYLSDDTWFCIHLMRSTGREVFGDREAAVLKLGMAGVGWFQPQVEETVPADKFIGLTPRQRTVLLMQLDGLSRKQIAANLAVSEHTVDDHLKAIFRHFGVHTAGELAALFLRGV